MGTEMNTSKLILSATGALSAILTIGAASAADLPMYTKAAPVVAPVANWTGFYIGGNVGGEWGKFNDPLSVAGVTAFGLVAPPVTIPLTSKNSSFTGGGQIGYRWQTASNWVVGIEGDLNWVDLKNSQILTLAQFPANNITFVPGDSFSVKTNWQSSIRGSVGYAWDRFLAYVTGGVAFANTQASSNFIQTTSGGITFPASAGSQTKTLVGGTVGVGLAYALNKNWDIGAEYRYTSYNGSDFGLGTVAAIAAPGGGTFAFVPATSHVDLSTNEIRFRANYRFDWSAPVVAKY
jgi:outer membrane immunogenic protein